MTTHYCTDCECEVTANKDIRCENCGSGRIIPLVKSVLKLTINFSKTPEQLAEDLQTKVIDVVVEIPGFDGFKHNITITPFARDKKI